ncbi:DUF3047 domain-containing protein [Aurantivibrio infirmus]
MTSLLIITRQQHGQSISFFFCLLLVCLLFSVSFPANSAKADLYLSQFSKGILNDWKMEEFDGETEYLIVEDNGNKVLQASSRASASGLVKKRRIDLWQLPYLNWSWKIDNRLPQRNETTKEGDDYPVRIYVIIDGGFRFWRSKALNYVWTRGLSKDSTWNNAFAEKNVVMVSLRDANDEIGVWKNEKRNVLEDLQKYIDPKIRYIDGIAIMTDTDNTSSFVNAYYGEIFFSSQ